MRGATTTASSLIWRPSASWTPVRPEVPASICSTLPSVTVMPRGLELLALLAGQRGAGVPQ